MRRCYPAMRACTNTSDKNMHRQLSAQQARPIRVACVCAFMQDKNTCAKHVLPAHMRDTCSP
eukprot:11199206-Lingulodinium_polyedra.AAC.1